MMDKKTLLAHEARMSVEPRSAPALPQYLTEDEIALFQDLNSGKFQSNRLEQERICADYIRSALNRWHTS